MQQIQHFLSPNNFNILFPALYKVSSFWMEMRIVAVPVYGITNVAISHYL